MRSLAALTAAIFLFCAPLCAQSENPSPPAAPTHELRIHLALGAMLAAQGADLATTMYALGTQRYDEGNKAFAWLTQTPWAAGAVKMAVAAGFSFAMLRWHKQHPKLTFWLSAVAAGGYSALAVHNTRTVR